jgi:hypothetical protein
MSPLHPYIKIETAKSVHSKSPNSLYPLIHATMPSAGPANYNADLALLDVEMAVEYGVFREEYEDKKSFRKAAAEAGLSWAMVQAEKTRRSGKASSTEARNAGWALIAIEEEEKGVPMRTALKKADGGSYKDRFIHAQRLLLQKGAAPAPAAKPAAPAPAPAPAAKAAPKRLTPAPAAAPAAPAPAAPAAAAKTAEELAQAAWEEKYEEFDMLCSPAFRERATGRIFMRGKGVRQLDVEWDEDLGAWKDDTESAPAPAPVAAPAKTAEELAQAAWEEKYEEFSMEDIVCYREKATGREFLKEGLRQLGPEWDDDLGDFKAE